MSFLPVKRVRIADQVAAAIRDAILGGRYDAGDALPPERDLADQFGVNRSSVREAIRRLESWGLVHVRHGGGTWVADFVATANMQVLPYLLAPRGEVDLDLLRDLLELRVMLLGWTAAHAAGRATPDQLDGLSATLDRLEEASTPDALQEIDFEFFEQMVELTGNRVLILLTHAMRRVYLQNRDLFLRIYAEQSLDIAPLRRAVEAIRCSEADSASAAMAAYARSMIPAREAP